MKNMKDIFKSLRKAQEAVDEANKALGDVMSALDEDTLDKISGGTGNPFATWSRVPTAEIDDELRSKV